MVITERKAKFSKSQSIYKKRNLRFSNKVTKQNFERYDFDWQYIDGSSRKKATSKVLNNLVENKTVVEVEYETFSYVGNGIILGFKKNGLLLVDFYDDDFEVGVLKIVRKVKNIKKNKNLKSLMIRENFNRTINQFKYLEDYSLLSEKTSFDIENIVKKNLKLVNYENYLEYNIEDNVELYRFLKEKDVYVHIYAEDIYPVLSGKIIDVKEDSFEIKFVNEHLLCFNKIVNFEDVEYISLSLLQKDDIYTNAFSKDFSCKEYDSVIKNINHNYSIYVEINYNIEYFLRSYDDELVEIDENLLNIIFYLKENEECIEKIKLNYQNDKSIVDNIIDNFDKSLLEVDLDNYSNEILNIETKKGTVSRVLIISQTEKFIVCQTLFEKESIIVLFKDKIEKITCDYSLVTKFKENRNDFQFTDLSSMMGKICWIKTDGFIDWCFEVVSVDERNIIAKSFTNNYCLLPNEDKIPIDKIIEIDISNDYMDLVNIIHTKYKVDKITLKYERFYKKIYELIQNHFDEKLGFNWYVESGCYLNDENTFNFDVSCQEMRYCCELKTIKNTFDDDIFVSDSLSVGCDYE